MTLRKISLFLLVLGIILIIFNNPLGLLLALVGVILLYRETSPKRSTEHINRAIEAKREELENINVKLRELENNKEKELDEKLNKKEKEKNKKLDELLKNKKEQLDKINETFKEKEKEKNKELDNLIKSKKKELDNINEIFKEKEKIKKSELNEALKNIQTSLNIKQERLEELQDEIIQVEDEIEIQSYGLYEPRYKFIDAVSYKERLDAVRKEQKLMIKEKTAAKSIGKISGMDSARSEKYLTNVNIKQILRTFNLEAENVINKVKHSNVENSIKRLEKSFNQLNKLYSREQVAITQHYYNLKLDELHIAYEYEQKKQEEKEMLREAREQEREEKKLQKKLEKEKNKFDKENIKLEEEIKKVKHELTTTANEEKAKLEEEIQRLQKALENNEQEIEKIDKWKETPGAGYVYIISNIGAFGKNVFKIGVTRRDDPTERIRELSSASVPFRYDAHVFIFSKDAYSLETELHERFDKKRVNKVNRRKEFFNITIDEVKQIVEENKASVHSFVEKPDAEEYYDTLKIEESLKKD